MEVRTCAIEDVKTLRALAIKTYRETFDFHNNEENMKAYLDQAYNLAKLEKELLNEASTFYFLYDEGALIGYLKVNDFSAQSDVHDPESLELERIYILADYHGKGYGKILMDKAIEVANEKNKKYIWLGVWEHNDKALAFYQKHGFYQFGAHDFVMGDDAQTDYLMRKNL